MPLSSPNPAADGPPEMSGNVRECPDLPGSSRQERRTNPPLSGTLPHPPASAAMSGNVRKCPLLSGSERETDRTNPPSLTPRQVLAAEVLGRGASVAAAARHLGLNERTVRRWKLRPEFAEAVASRLAANRQAVQRVTVRPARLAPAVPRFTSAGGRPPMPVTAPPPEPERVRVFEGVRYATFEEYMAAIDRAMGRAGPAGRRP